MTFDPKFFNIIMGGVSPTMLSEGEFIKYTPDDDSYVLVKGADGRSSRVKTNSNTGVAEVTLQAASPTNDEYQALVDAEEATPGGAPFDGLINDTLGRTKISADNCWVISNPEIGGSSSDDMPKVWKFQLTGVKQNTGGSV